MTGNTARAVRVDIQFSRYYPYVVSRAYIGEKYDKSDNTLLASCNSREKGTSWTQKKSDSCAPVVSSTDGYATKKSDKSDSSESGCFR